MNVRVPLVNIQTAVNVTIRLAVPNTPMATTVPFYGTGSIRVIGAAKGLTKSNRDQTREVTRIYGFNGNEFEPQYVVPGQLTTKLTLSSIVFNAADFLSSMGNIRGSLIYQENPFIVIQDEYTITPAGSVFGINYDASTTLARSIYYMDCWLENNPIEYDIMDDDMLVVQELNVAVGKSFSTEETGQRGIETVGKFLENLILKPKPE